MNKRDVFNILDAIVKDRSYTMTNLGDIVEARDYIASVLNAENNKANKVDDLAKVANQILKTTNKLSSKFRGATTIYDMQYVCNGTCLMWTSKDIALPQVELGKEETIYDYRDLVDRIGADITGNEIVIPSLKELKTALADQKSKCKINGSKFDYAYYKFDNGLCMNVQYLIWAVSATCSQTAKMSDSVKKGILFNGNGVKFFCLPCNCPDVEAGYHYQAK